MFTQAVKAKKADAYFALLGASPVSTLVLTQDENRPAYFAGARDCTSHLFLDSDTGVRMESMHGKKAPAYIFFDELVDVAKRHKHLLTMVFDQCLPRGDEKRVLANKLEKLEDKGLQGFAYQSHACFLLMSQDPSLVLRARRILNREAHLAEDRFITRPTP